jgi:hypothetical protein
MTSAWNTSWEPKTVGTGVGTLTHVGKRTKRVQRTTAGQQHDGYRAGGTEQVGKSYQRDPADGHALRRQVRSDLDDQAAEPPSGGSRNCRW